MFTPFSYRFKFTSYLLSLSTVVLNSEMSKLLLASQHGATSTEIRRGGGYRGSIIVGVLSEILQHKILENRKWVAKAETFSKSQLNKSSFSLGLIRSLDLKNDIKTTKSIIQKIKKCSDFQIIKSSAETLLHILLLYKQKTRDNLCWASFNYGVATFIWTATTMYLTAGSFSLPARNIETHHPAQGTVATVCYPKHEDRLKLKCYLCGGHAHGSSYKFYTIYTTPRRLLY